MTSSHLLLLGVTEPSAPPVFSDIPHIGLRCARWTAIALPVALDGPESEEDRMTRWAMAQGDILCRQVRAADVFPVRLGAVFSTAAALIAHVDARERELEIAASACRGCVELAVQALPDAGPAPEMSQTPPIGGRAFLDRRRSARDHRSRSASDRRRFVSGLTAALAPLSKDLRARDVQGRAPLADWSVLLARGSIGSLLDLLEVWDRQARAYGLRLKVTGPWPPFAFIGGT